MDAIATFKEAQRQAWSVFAPFEMVTGTAAPRLVAFARVTPGAELLDVGCGTGVVALTAARAGARASGLDLTPELLERAKQNAALMKVEVQWQLGDAEQLPFPDAKFDFVVSQFGHMFAPRPDVTVQQMLRVLKPGGTIAFSTWPPELFTGRMFALVGRYAPPPAPGISPPPQWGDPNIIRERLGSGVKDLQFDRHLMRFQALSVVHFRQFIETNVGPVMKLVQNLEKSDPAKLVAFRRELEELASHYFEDNTVRQDFLMTRATKA